MNNILAEGREWFADVRTEWATIDVRYIRGAQTFELKASQGQRIHDAEEEGLVYELISSDFIVRVADMQGLIPQRGDRIQLVDTNEVHEILPMPGNQVYRQDPEGIEFRIHCKRVLAGGTAPVATISSNQTDPTNAPLVTLTIFWSEEVTDFDQSSIIPDNCNITGFREVTNAVRWEVDVEPISDGLFGIDLPAGAANAVLTGLPSEAASFRQTYDTVRPDITLSYTGPDPTGDQIVTVDMTSTKTLRAFDASVFDVTNGQVVGIRPITSARFEVDIEATNDGFVSVVVPANSVFDVAGNGNTESNTVTWEWDSVKPDITLTYDGDDPTGKLTEQVTMSSDKALQPFDESAFTVTNGSASNLTPSGVNEWTVDITADGSGLVTVQVEEDAVQDTSGNGNEPSNVVSWNVDVTAPQITLTYSGNDPTNQTTQPLVMTSDTPVQPFTDAVFQVTNGSASNLRSTGVNEWTVDITADDDGLVSVVVPADSVFDDVGNGNETSNTESWTVDTVVPVLTLSYTGDDPTNGLVQQIGLNSTKVLQPFNESIFSVSNGSASNLQQVDANNWTVDITATNDGLVSAFVLADAVSDPAGNSNAQSNTVSWTLDRVAPVVSLAYDGDTPTNQGTVPVRFVSDKALQPFTDSIFEVTNGTAGNLRVSGANEWTVDITATADGLVSVVVRAGAVLDLAGNPNAIDTNTVSWTVDRLIPTATLNYGGDDPTTQPTVTVALALNKSVEPFTDAIFDVTNGSASNLQGSGVSWTVDITADADGAVSVVVPADAISDAAGNTNAESNTVSWTVDTTNPVPTLDVPTSHDGTAFDFDINWTEPVNGFSIAGLQITGGTLNNFRVIDRDQYRCEAIPNNGDDPVTLQVLASTATDDAGNPNDASTLETVEALVLTTIVVPVSTDQSPFSAQVVFGEAMEDLDVTAFVVGNGAASNLTTGDGITWDFQITPTQSGNVNVRLPANSCTAISDGRGNADSGIETTLYAPEVGTTLVAPTESPTTPFQITITFTEPVDDFVATDITVTNGSAGNLQTADDTQFTAEITPTASGNVTMQVLADKATSQRSGRGNSASTLETTLHNPPVTVDIDAPAQAAAAFTIDIDFSEPVRNFVATDIDVVNGTPSNLLGGPQSYTATITPAGVGNVRTQIPANVADSIASGVLNDESAQETTLFAPVVTADVTEIAADDENSTKRYNVQFSEPVTWVYGVGDINITSLNAQVTLPPASSDGGTNWQYEITVDDVDAGTIVSHFVEADVAFSQATARGNDQSNTFNSTYTPRVIKPFFTGDAVSANGEATVTLNFLEDVTGVETTDFQLTSGQVDSVVEVSPQEYTVELSQLSSGAQSVTYPAGAANAAKDGRATAASDPWAITVSQVTADLVETTVGGTTVSRKLFKVTFGEAMNWTYQAGDITVTNGSVTVPPTTGDGGISWDFACDPTNVNLGTTVTVTVEDDVATSISNGLENAQSNSVGAVYVPRSISADFSGDAVSNDGTADVVLTFSEDMDGVEITDFTLSTGTIQTLTPRTAAIYDLEIIGLADGAQTIDYPAGAATALLDGRENDAAPQWTITVTLATPPEVDITETTPGGVTAVIKTFSATFDEPVTWVYEAGDIVISSANAQVTTTPASGDGGTTWVYALTVDDPDSPATVTHNIAADAANAISSGLGNVASDPNNATYTPRALVPVFSGDDEHSDGTAQVRLTFPEDVTGVEAGDFGLTSGVVDLVTELNAREYDVDLSGMSVDDPTTVSYAAGQATAIDGRTNDAAVPWVITPTGVSFDPDAQSEDLLGALWDGASPPTEYVPTRRTTLVRSRIYPSMGDLRPVEPGWRLVQAGTQRYESVTSALLAPTYPMAFFVEVYHPRPLNFESTRPIFAIANPGSTTEYSGPAIYSDSDSTVALRGQWQWQHRAGGGIWTAVTTGINALRDEPTRAVMTIDGANFRQFWAYDRITRLWTHVTDNSSGSLLGYGSGRIGWGAPRSGGLVTSSDLCSGAFLRRLPTAQEIELFRESGVVPADCAVMYQHEEGTGTTIYDNSGNGLHASIINNYTGIRAETDAASMANEIGFTRGTGGNGAAAGVIIPVDRSNPTQDVLGNPLDYTGRAPLDGTVHGTPGVSTDAGGQRIDVQDVSILSVVPGDTIEVECLMLVQEWGTQGGLGKVDIGENRGWALVTAAPPTNYRFRVDAASTGNGQMRVNTQDPIVLNQWVHVRAAWDGTNAAGVQMWIDGVPQVLNVTNDDLSGPPDYSGLLMRIGRTSPSHQTTGAFCNLRITHNGSEYHWPLNEAAGTILRETVQQKHGVFIGAVLPDIWRRSQDLTGIAQVYGNSTKMRFSGESVMTGVSFAASGRIAAQIAVESGSGLQIGMGNVVHYIGIRDGNPVCAAGDGEVVGTTTLELTQSAEVEMRWDSGNIELWVNGVQEGSGTGNPVGIINLGDSSMQGPVAHAKIYDGGGTLTNHWPMEAARDWQRARDFRGADGFRGVGPGFGDGDNFMVVAWCLDNQGPGGGICADFRSGAYWLMQTNYSSQYVRFYFNASNPAEVTAGSAMRDAWIMLSMDYHHATTTGHGELWFQSGQHGTDEVTMDRSGMVSSQLDVGHYNISQWLDGKIGPIAIFKPANPPAVRDAINAKMHNGGRGSRLHDFTPQEIADWGLVAFYEMNEGNGPMVDALGGPRIDIAAGAPADTLGVDATHWEDVVGGQHIDFTTLSQNFQNFSGNGTQDSSGAPLIHVPADGMVPSLGESISLTQDVRNGWPAGDQRFPARHREHSSIVQGRDDLFASNDPTYQQRRFLLYREDIIDAQGARDYVNEEP